MRFCRMRKTPSFAQLRPASVAASRAKRANRKTDTRHELLMFEKLKPFGFRCRRNLSSLPGTPDIVFVREKVAVFCDGDFWHGNDWRRLRRQLLRRHNADYWIAKIGRNRDRDVETMRKLQGDGWHVIRVWESEILRNPDKVAHRVVAAVQKRRAQRGRGTAAKKRLLRGSTRVRRSDARRDKPTRKLTSFTSEGIWERLTEWTQHQ